MTTLSSEELQAQRSDFGLRLSNSMAKYGPLCVGIDPHRKLLTDWGYNVDAEGAELFSMRMLQAANGAPQQSNSRRRCSSATEPKVSKRSSACSTRHDKWASSPSSIACAAACPPRFPPSQTPISSPVHRCWPTPITLLPYYGARSLNGLITEALENGRGVFIASLTSNPEGMSLQTALRQSGDYKGRTVAYGIASTAQKHNVDIEGMGSVGLIIGATIGQWMQDSGVDPSKFTGPILSPGYGWQGAEAKDLKTVFRGTRGNVLVTVSRFIASHGPDIAALSQATESIALDVRQALMEATVEGSENQ